MIKNFWLALPSHVLYRLSPFALQAYSRINPSKRLSWKPVSWRHLVFDNPLGTAGGVDKNALHIQDWWRLGPGFLEIGTVTPEAQQANPFKILDRSLKYKSLWNNMGFPNKGLCFVKKQLQKLPPKKQTALFINIGKNKTTTLQQAFQDYKKLILNLHTFADAFVINISSPNTKNLRQMFDKNRLLPFLKSLKQLTQDMPTPVPLILKISPDEDNFLRIIEQSIEANIDGWCICNSTKQRSIPKLFPDHGGVSGKLLSATSQELLKDLNKYLLSQDIKDKLIISCGGVFTVQDVLERLQAGASLVQVYSALVFHGPNFFNSLSQKILKIN